MRIVRDRADARWLPSRFRFAAFRLFAWLRLRRMAPRPAPGVVLAVDRDQSAVEQYVAGALIEIVAACYLAAALMKVVPALLAVVLAIPLAPLIVQVPMYALGISLTLVARAIGHPGENHLAPQGWLLALMLGAPAVWLVTTDSWLRFPSAALLACAAVNAIAAVILFLLRRRIASLEERFGVEN